MTPTVRSVDRAVLDFPVAYARTARFTLGTPRNLAVTGNGSTVLFCRSRQADDPVLCLWALDVASGEERMVVDPAELGDGSADLPPAERARRERARESASGIVAYAVDGDGTTVCFALAGALFVADVATGRVISPELAGTAFDPRLNCQGTAVAYVDGGQLRVVELGPDGPAADRPLRSDDDPLVSFGRAEFIAAEEMDRSRGYWWGPDGARLLVARVDEHPVDQWWIADPAHPDRPPAPIRYPAAGTTNALVGLELVTLDGTVTGIDWSDGGHWEYLVDVIWDPERPPLVVRQARDQRTISMAEIDLGRRSTDGSPSVGERYRITDAVWVEPVPGSPRWCSDGLLTGEDRGDDRTLVLDGVTASPPGLQVRSIVGVLDGDGGDRPEVVITGSYEPTEIHLWRVPLGVPPTVDAITEGATVNGGVLGAATLVVTTADPGRPGTALTIRSLTRPDGTADGPRATIADHSAEPGFAAAPLFCSLGPTELRSALFLPSGHDGAESLPVLLDPYGGPHAQRVLRAHNPHLVSRWFAEQGYAVLVTDGRGTPARGPGWERAVWGDLAGPVLDDQVTALDAALERHPFLDGGRVAMRGWSFGGYLAALAVLRRPDRFHAAIAGAPVTTWRLYDTHYTERYLGHPDQHPEHYDRSDLWYEDDDGAVVPPLERPLLLIHGLADDNVVAAHTLRFSTVLLAAGFPHRVLPLSGVTHMTPQEAVAENLLRLQLDFLDEAVSAR